MGCGLWCVSFRFQMAILIHLFISFCDKFQEVTRDIRFHSNSRWDYTCTLKRRSLSCIVSGQCKCISWSIVALADFVSDWTWMPHFHISSLSCHPPLHGPPGAVMCFFQISDGHLNSSFHLLLWQVPRSHTRYPISFKQSLGLHLHAEKKKSFVHRIWAVQVYQLINMYIFCILYI